MRAFWKVNTAYSFTIVVFDVDTPVTGLVTGDFVNQIAKDDANSAVTVTVTEIDSVNEPGWYKVTYTPTAVGHWVVRVYHATYNPRGWLDDAQVGVAGGLDDIPTAAQITAAVPTAAQNAAAVFAITIDGSTFTNVMKWIAAVALGKGTGTAASPYRAIDDSADRVSSTFSGSTRLVVTKTP